MLASQMAADVTQFINKQQLDKNPVLGVSNRPYKGSPKKDYMHVAPLPDYNQTT
jgi:hypothetical protein